MVRTLSVVKYSSHGVKIAGTPAIARVKVAAATAGFVLGGTPNTAPDLEIDLPLQFYVNHNNRQLAGRVATATIKATTGNTLAEVGQYRRVPLLNAAIQAIAADGDSTTTVSHLGSTDWEFVGFNGERFNGRAV